MKHGNILVNIITGFQYKNTTANSFGDFPGGITFGLNAYANVNEKCINDTMSEFLQHVSFYMLGNYFIGGSL